MAHITCTIIFLFGFVALVQTAVIHPAVRQINGLPIPPNITAQLNNGKSSSSGVGFGSGAPGSGGGGGFAIGGGAAAGGGGGTTKGGSGGGIGASTGASGSGRSCTNGICTGGTAYGAYDAVKNATKERKGANGFGFGSGSVGKGGGGGIGVNGGAGGGGGGGDKTGGTGGGAAAAAGAGAFGDGKTNTTYGYGSVAGVGYNSTLPTQQHSAPVSGRNGNVEDDTDIPTIVVGGLGQGKESDGSSDVGLKMPIPPAGQRGNFNYNIKKGTIATDSPGMQVQATTAKGTASDSVSVSKQPQVTAIPLPGSKPAPSPPTKSSDKPTAQVTAIPLQAPASNTNEKKDDKEPVLAAIPPGGSSSEPSSSTELMIPISIRDSSS